MQSHVELARARQLAETLAVRPNTGMPVDFLQPNLVVCPGEDPAELEHAMAVVLGSEYQAYQYRCYRGYRFAARRLTVLLSGIGSGCLEPLMFEALDSRHTGPDAVRRLVLIGTAGYIGDALLGRVYLVDGAYTVGCAVELTDDELPVRPRFDAIETDPLTKVEEVSTDYYYATTVDDTDPRKQRAKQKNRALRDGLAKYYAPGRLIAMESAQFYHFADVYGTPETQYVALRGVANLADQFHTQSSQSRDVLTDTLQHAIRLLRV